MNEFGEAVVILSKCRESHKMYGMRAEKVGSNHWMITWAFPIKESSAKREGYDKIRVQGQIDFAESYPGCPYCGQTGFTLCNCGHLNCTILRNGLFKCEWCGAEGTIGAYTGDAISAGVDY